MNEPIDADTLSDDAVKKYSNIFRKVDSSWTEEKVRQEFEYYKANRFLKPEDIEVLDRFAHKKARQFFAKISDNAMFSTQPEELFETRVGDPNLKGGIDFDPTAMKFETTGDAAMINVTSEQLQQFMDAPGFEPFIINIAPVVSPRIWLGLNAEEESEKPKQTADTLWKNSLSYVVKQEEEINV